MYIEHSETTLPKLKKAYFKKCQEAEDQKRQDTAVALQAKLLSDPVQYERQSPPLGAATHDPLGNAYTSPPTITSPLPPMANPAISSSIGTENDATSGGRRRAGSAGQADKTKDVFGELANSGKRGLNAFMAKFGGEKDKPQSPDESTPAFSPPSAFNFGSPPNTGGIGQVTSPGFDGSGGHGKTPSLSFGAGRIPDGVPVKASAMKGAKLRREADEADKAYRQAVFHLESLRLRKQKIQNAAFDSYQEFTNELCSTLRLCLTAYVDCSSATAATNQQMVEHPRKSIEAIDPTKDGRSKQACYQVID